MLYTSNILLLLLLIYAETMESTAFLGTESVFHTFHNAFLFQSSEGIQDITCSLLVPGDIKCHRFKCTQSHLHISNVLSLGRPTELGGTDKYNSKGKNTLPFLKAAYYSLYIEATMQQLQVWNKHCAIIKQLTRQTFESYKKIPKSEVLQHLLIQLRESGERGSKMTPSLRLFPCAVLLRTCRALRLSLTSLPLFVAFVLQTIIEGPGKLAHCPQQNLLFSHPSVHQ